MDHVLKTTVLLRDIDEFNDMNRVHAQYFRENVLPVQRFRYLRCPADFMWK